MVLFVLLLVLFATLIVLAPVSLVRPVAHDTAVVAGGLIRAVGIQNSVEGNMIYLQKRILQIRRDCTGIQLIAVFAALVLAFPAASKEKMRAFAIGVPALLVLNMGRLVGAGAAAQYLPSHFDFIHNYLFQVLLALAVMLIWLAWMSGLDSNAR